MNDKIGRGQKVRLYLDIWYEEGDGAIHITAPDIDNEFHPMVNDNPKSIRCHMSVYNLFKRVLKESGCWLKE